MKKAGFVPAPLWVGALLCSVCTPTGTSWSAPGIVTPAQDASSVASRADWYRSLIRKGHASERLGQRQDALADYTLAIENHALSGNDLVQVLFDRGRLLDGMGRPKDALADYSAALSLSPDFVAALNNRAGVYAQLGQLAEARRDYLSALGVADSSERPHSYFGLGRIAEAQGDLAEAREFYNRALAADPRFGPATERLGVLLASRENIGIGATAPAADDPGGGPSNRRRLEAQLQLGAWRSEQRAARGWDHARALASDVLGGAAPRIVAVDLPGAGRFYRLRVTVAQSGSRGLCVALAAKGLDCMLVHD